MKKLVNASQIRIGTRGSPLALAQANETAARLTSVHGAKLAIELRVIKTSGDKIQDRALLEVGGKGLFTKELEEALLDGSIDLAVHSMKDMPAILPEALEIACILPREDVRDALICECASSLDGLPRQAVVGTASIRREAFVRNRRPDVSVVLFRGNVETRLRKLAAGEAHATLLAAAGLNRLGLSHRAAQFIPVEEMLPAPAQGAVGIEIRTDDHVTRDLLGDIHDRAAGIEVAAERAFLAELDGSCRTPIAALARVSGDAIAFRGMVLSPDGVRVYETARTGHSDDAAALGLDAAKEIFRQGGRDVFRAVA